MNTEEQALQEVITAVIRRETGKTKRLETALIVVSSILAASLAANAVLICRLLELMTG